MLQLIFGYNSVNYHLCKKMKKDQEHIKIQKQLRTAVWNAMEEYNMISNGDKVMVCISGGKDSYTMLDMLVHFQKFSDLKFEIIAVNLDQKQPGFPEEVLPNYLSKMEIPYQIVEKDTYSIVKEKVPEGKTTCSLCSRLRRGILYDTARKLNCNVVALGHHREDILETFFLNLFFSGKLETMPPKYKIDKGDLVVIRPLSYCKEEMIAAYATHKKYPIIPCDLCGSQPLLQRQQVKHLMTQWEKDYPNRKAVMLNALKNISPSHLLDKNLFDFKDLNKAHESIKVKDDSQLVI